MTMTDKLSRRRVLSGGAGLAAMALSACSPTGSRVARLDDGPPRRYVEMYSAIPSEPYPVPAVNLDHLESRYYRQIVPDPTGERPGTVVVNTRERFLYLVRDGGEAMRYGVGVGRQGFSWSGRGTIAYKKHWPTWTPPASMIEREPYLEEYRDGMAPGPQNPLGARALYIFEDGRDTLYRVHGSPEVRSIGRAVSSGCIRLLQQDIIDLYGRVPSGSPILVT